MIQSTLKPALGAAAYYGPLFLLTSYFTFAAVQGEYGVFRQVEIRAESETLTAERDRLSAELSTLTNLTLRLSDSYLDLDLLDQQAREILGFLRPDEIVLR
ncbi:septum formation initiator family protein [Brevundimonas sp.]|uniref:FtsB family cell division protein n=1 Tax=Brevundimonas sp. TaxID=1871086 RepID=UPI00286AEE59|nr:septum formation initiator family protein [Brevundimonas sp.]